MRAQAARSVSFFQLCEAPELRQHYLPGPPRKQLVASRGEPSDGRPQLTGRTEQPWRADLQRVWGKFLADSRANELSPPAMCFLLFSLMVSFPLDSPITA